MNLWPDCCLSRCQVQMLTSVAQSGSTKHALVVCKKRTAVKNNLHVSNLLTAFMSAIGIGREENW